MTLIKKKENGLFPVFNRMMEDFFDRDFMDWPSPNFSAAGTTLPAVNVKESDKAYEVEMAAPGLKKEDFTVEFRNNMLIISSEKREEFEEKEAGNFTRKEFSYQSFQRSIALPANSVDEENIKARYENGVLSLTVPKKAEFSGQKGRRIEIS